MAVEIRRETGHDGDWHDGHHDGWGSGDHGGHHE